MRMMTTMSKQLQSNRFSRMQSGTKVKLYLRTIVSCHKTTESISGFIVQLYTKYIYIDYYDYLPLLVMGPCPAVLKTINTNV